MLSDRERRELEAIERGLLDSDPGCARRFRAAYRAAPSTAAGRMAAGYAELAVISGSFGVLVVSRWPVLAGLLLVAAGLTWRAGLSAGRRPPQPPPG